MQVIMDIDLEKFRWSLVGDGYLREEVAAMTEEKLVEILRQRITDHINAEYDKSVRYGFLEDEEEEAEDDDVTFGDIYEEFKSNYPDFANDVADYRPYCPPYIDTVRPYNILLWINDGTMERYSYETKQLYPVYVEEE